MYCKYRFSVIYFIFSNNGGFPKRRLRKMKRSRLSSFRKINKSRKKAPKFKSNYFSALLSDETLLQRRQPTEEDRKNPSAAVIHLSAVPKRIN